MYVIKGRGEFDKGKDISQLEFNEFNAEIHIEDSLMQLIITFGNIDFFNNRIVYFYGEDKYIKIYLRANFRYNQAEIARMVTFDYSDYSCIKEKVINNISEVSFTTEVLQFWLRENPIMDNGISAEYRIIPLVSLQDSGPKITIEYQPGFYNHGFDKTKVILESKPYVKICYSEQVDILKVEKDIVKMVRFLGIMIGRIDKVEDITIKIEDFNRRCAYNTAIDFSHNVDLIEYNCNPRTQLKELTRDVKLYYEQWCKFYDEYRIIIDYFFRIHDNRSKFNVDTFIDWCKMIDGYYIRNFEEDERADILEQSINEIYFDSEFHKKIRSIFKDKKINSKSSHKNVPKWIKAGFLSRVSFGQKLKKICDENFDMIINNLDIIGVEAEANIYDMYNNTRNYYSHLKKDDKDCLDEIQMFESNRVFYAIFISIFMKSLGMSEDEIKLILKKDTNVSFLMRSYATK